MPYARCILVVLFVSACGPSAPTSWPSMNLFQAGSGERVFREVAYDTLWTYGRGGSVIARATVIDANASGDAWVLDTQSQEIHRVSANGVVWSWGSRGRGPGELWNARALAVDEDGLTIVADSGNRRFYWISAEGTLVREAPFPDPYPGEIDGIVPSRGRGYVLSTIGSERLVHLSESGDSLSTVSLPWEGFHQMHPLQTFGRLAGGNGSKWVFGFGVGNGFFVFRQETLIDSHPYVEHSEFPAMVTSVLSGDRLFTSYVERPHPTARDIAIAGDTLLVLPGDPRWLDLYDLSTGVYLETWELPASVVRGIAWVGGTLLFIDGTGLYPVVTAIRATE